MRGEPFCFFHDRWLNRPAEDSFPHLEDSNSIQLALMQVIERLRREAFRAGSLDPRLVKPLIFALKVAGQNARHTSFDGAGFRSQFVTEMPSACISDPEALPAAKNGAGKPPRPERGSAEADLVDNG